MIIVAFVCIFGLLLFGVALLTCWKELGDFEHSLTVRTRGESRVGQADATDAGELGSSKREVQNQVDADRPGK